MDAAKPIDHGVRDDGFHFVLPILRLLSLDSRTWNDLANGCSRKSGKLLQALFKRQSFAFSRASFSAINARISSDLFRSFNHCSLYNVTGKRPIP